jgi:hypothetical protein
LKPCPNKHGFLLLVAGTSGTQSVPLGSVGVECGSETVVPALKVRGVESPELADTIPDHATVSGQALKRLRVNTKDSGGLIAIQERLRNRLEIGHGSYAS